MAGILDLFDTMSPSSWMTPAMGSLMATDPEAAVRHLATQGVPPPAPAPDRNANGELINPYAAPNETYSRQGAPASTPPSSDWRPNWLAQGVNAIKQFGAPTTETPVQANPGGEQPGSYNPLEAPALTNFSAKLMGAPLTQQTAPAPGIPPQAEPSPSPLGGDPLGGVAGGAPSNQIGNLAKALSGVKAPPNPEFQKIRSPDAPHPVGIPQGSPVAALLAKAVAGDPQAMMTLRAAIGGGR